MNSLARFSLRNAMLLLAFTGSLAEADVLSLTHQHADFRLQYTPGASNQLGLVIGYDESAGSFRVNNTNVFIVGGSNAVLTLPDNPNFAFLGQAGSRIWILPQVQNAALPFLGVSAEDVPLGVFDGPLALRLRTVEGPGNFFVWATTGGGAPPIVKMVFTNGVVNGVFNQTQPVTGSHEHFNWGFSTSGLYNVTFQVLGKRIGEATNLTSEDISWSFELLPLRPYEQWVVSNWPPATLKNIAGPGVDPDGEGTVNLLEYAFGTDPNVALRTNLPSCSFAAEGGTNYGALTYTWVTNASDLILSPVAASGLSSSSGWSPISNTISSVSNGPTTRLITVRDSQPAAASAQRFYQLNVQLMP